MYRNIALLSLVIQNAGIILSTKYSFRNAAQPYSQAATIFLSELIKLFASLLLELQACNWSGDQLRKSLMIKYTNVVMIVPASLYVLQNISQMKAIRGLSPAVYVTGVQLKVLTAAVFSAFLLKRHLNARQIFSFFPLMIGVALVQYGTRDDAVRLPATHAFMSLFVAVTLSGLAGALMEMSFKQEGESLWVKNVYLSIFSIPSSFYAAKVDLNPNNFLAMMFDLTSGFDVVVWLIVILLAQGGLFTAVVMKYAGALTKCYAVSVSIIICTVVSSISGVQTLTPEISLGSILVICSVFLYSSNPSANT